MNQLPSIQAGQLGLRIDPRLAGRVTQLVYRGQNLLSTAEANANNWGATYWTSPQSDWGWPPVVEVDSAPYRLTEDSPQQIVVVSPQARLDERHFVIEKRFSVGPKDDVIDTFYTIENVGSTSFQMANWEISRVPPGGLTFYPTGAAELNGIAPHSAVPIQKEFGTTFYDHGAFEGDKCLKLHADGQGGYLAHLQGELLLLKIFQDTPPEKQAPGEGECEIFANEDGKYVEIEVQGPYATILPGARSTFRVRTVVVPLAVHIKRSDRSALRVFADECAARFLG